MAAMVKHLASLAGDRLILSFAPSTPALLVLKRIGEFFPKGSKVRCGTPSIHPLQRWLTHARALLRMSHWCAVLYTGAPAGACNSPQGIEGVERPCTESCRFMAVRH